MKKSVMLVVLLVVMAMVAGNVLAADQGHLDVSVLSYTPVPAQPGGYVTVTLKVMNTGNGDTTDAAIEFVNNYPFSMDNQAEMIKSIGVLGSQDTYLAEFRVRIDPEAIEGTNYLKVRYTTDTGMANWVEKDLPLTVNSAQKTLSINNVEVSPKSVMPGGEAQVTLKIKNLAQSNLRDIGVKLNLEGAMVGSTYVDIPLAPIGSSVEKKISLLKTGQSADFDFVLQAYPDATAGIYKIPVTLTYTDENGKEYSRTDLISLVINAKPELMVTIDDSTLYSDNGMGDVSFMVTNKGLTDIKFLTVTLGQSDAYTIKSVSDETYVGNVDSDDYEIATFSVLMNKQGLDHVEFPVTLHYKDALNNDQTMQETLSLPLISTKEAGKEKSKTGLVIVIIVVLALIIFFVVRARKKKARR